MGLARPVRPIWILVLCWGFAIPWAVYKWPYFRRFASAEADERVLIGIIAAPAALALVVGLVFALSGRLRRRQRR